MPSNDIQEPQQKYVGEYGPSMLQKWAEIADRHRCRDTVFLQSLSAFFKPGKMLELGAATGNISEILLQMGFNIMPSDLSPTFVHAMRVKGMDARIVDAQNICSSIDEKFDTILTSALSPFIVNSPNSISIKKTYQSIHSSLHTGGRLIFIFPRFSVIRYMLSKNITARKTYESESSLRVLKKKYATVRTHVMVIRQMGIFRIKEMFRHQVLPTSMYTERNMKLLNFIDFAVGRALGERTIFVLEKVEKSCTNDCN